MQKIIVTGGSGFIGSNLVKFLLKKNYFIINIDNLSYSANPYNLKEIKTVCWCGRKATMVVRLDKKGNILTRGEQVEIGGNEKYVPLCRAHFNKKDLGS